MTSRHSSEGFKNYIAHQFVLEGHDTGKKNDDVSEVGRRKQAPRIGCICMRCRETAKSHRIYRISRLNQELDTGCRIRSGRYRSLSRDLLNAALGWMVGIESEIECVKEDDVEWVCEG
jgi:hypothetical protein